MLKSLYFLVLFGINSIVFAQNQHDDILNACSACHGFDGVSKEVGIPNLWGQPETYLQSQIEAFRDASRINPRMDAVSHELPDADILYAAQHYSKQLPEKKLKLQWRGEKWPGDMTPGERIAYTSNLSAKLPACVVCHGPSGVGVEPYFPRLAGQDKDYLVKQLKTWKTADRPAGVMGVMVSIAISLTDDEIDAVAGYFATLNGVK